MIGNKRKKFYCRVFVTDVNTYVYIYTYTYRL